MKQGCWLPNKKNTNCFLKRRNRTKFFTTLGLGCMAGLCSWVVDTNAAYYTKEIDVSSVNSNSDSIVSVTPGLVASYMDELGVAIKLTKSDVNNVFTNENSANITLNYTASGLKSVDLYGISAREIVEDSPGSGTYQEELFDIITTNKAQIDLIAIGTTFPPDIASPGNSGASAAVYGIDSAVNINEGDINVTARAGSAYHPFEASPTPANALSYGIYGNVEKNTGAITTEAIGGLSNNVMARSSVYACGIWGDVIINEGTIIATGKAGIATTDSLGPSRSGSSSFVYGIKGNVGKNTGSIKVIGEGGVVSNNVGSVNISRVDSSSQVYGISNSSEGGRKPSKVKRGSSSSVSAGDTLNSGAIDAMAIAGKKSVDGGVTWVGGSARAFGINEFGNIVNTKTASIKTVAQQASGVDADSSGTELKSYGIYFNDTGSLDSAGLIDAEVQDHFGNTISRSNFTSDIHAYQVYAGSGTTTIHGFAMDFKGSQAELDSQYEGAIGAASGATVQFGSDATLYVYVNGEIKASGNTYSIPTLIAGDSQKGYFSRAEEVYINPDYKLVGMSAKSETELQTITFEYRPQASSPLLSAQGINTMAQQSRAIVNTATSNTLIRSMFKNDPRLASFEGVAFASNDQSTDVNAVLEANRMEEKGSVFFQPYYVNSSYDSNPVGYDADVYGFVGGYNYQPSKDLIFGFHAGYGNIDMDYSGEGYGRRGEEVDAGYVGVQGAWSFNDKWLLKGTSTLTFTSNDYKDRAVTNQETGNYDTWNIRTGVDLGYIFMVGNSFFIPEIGLTHLYYSADSFTTDNRSNNDVTYSDVSENEVYAHLGMSWYGNYESGEWDIMPRVKVGLEQTLTDGEYANSLTSGGLSRSVSYDADTTAVITNLGLDFGKGPVVLGAGYSGYYSSDIDDHSLYLELRYSF